MAHLLPLGRTCLDAAAIVAWNRRRSPHRRSAFSRGAEAAAERGVTADPRRNHGQRKAVSVEISAVRGFSSLRALVVGDAMLDSYYLGSASRLSPEGPVPVIRSQEKRHLPGGAANTAANIRALGARTILLSVIGRDHEGDVLRDQLARRGVDVTHLMVDPGRPTTSKLRILGDNQFLARFDEEEDSDLTGEMEGAFLERFRRLFDESDVVIVSDYMKGTITPALVAELSRLNQGGERPVVVDSKDLARRSFHNVSVITPNHLEAQRAIGRREELDGVRGGISNPEELGRRLLDAVGTRWVIVTLGADGALLFERERPTVRVGAREVRSPDTVGAGDSFTAALALGLASRLEIGIASRIAVEAAAISVGKRMTAVVEQRELLQRLSLSVGDEAAGSLADRLERYRAGGKRLVFTNGAFDGLHSGHIDFLREARRLGDVLIVGVNSDESLRRRTGQSPRHPEEERLSVVASLESVDHCLLFDEETPSALIREIRPQIHVKGGDYQLVELPEAEAVLEVGGQVVILPLLERRSSRLLSGKVTRSMRRPRAA
jgi:D-beta-D-heptose 7-phosphate kinase / D-beta-D-heptose 1-phosphate adenosyltransferase